VQGVVYSPLVVIGMFAACDIILYIAFLGNPRTFLFVGAFQYIVDHVPPGSIFTCVGKQVHVTIYDPRADEEHTAALCYMDRWHPTFLLWKGGPRAVSRMKQLIAREALLHLCFFIFFFIPIIAASVWLAIAVNWRWVLALIFFVEWEAICAYLNGVLYLGRKAWFTLVGLSLNQAEHGNQEHHWIASALHINLPFSASLIIALLVLYVSPLLQARKIMRSRRQDPTAAT
jgi:hypothetical protein